MKKRFLSIILTLALLLSVVTVVGTVASADSVNKIGDCDMNGIIDITDARIIQRSTVKLVNLSDTQKILADVNKDGYITITDVTHLQKYLAGIPGVTLPEDTTQPSTDTTGTTMKPTTPTNPVISNNITIRFTNNQSWTSVYAYVWNSKSGTEAKAWPGEKMTLDTTNDYGEQIFKMWVDLSKYDRVIFNNNSNKQTVDIPLSKASSAFFIDTAASTTKTKYAVGTYGYGETDEGKITTTTLAYDSSTAAKTKKITIWTPPGYIANDKSKKYAVLYAIDGQNMFGSIANDPNCAAVEWEADENVISLMSNGADGVIVVGIDDATSNRDSELTPDLGPVIPEESASFRVRTGEYYSNFVVNKVMPYVEANFNVSTDRKLTGIIGSSSGGLESFYIGMEHMDKFGYIGALSPAFLLFNESVWSSYLNKLDFSNKEILPRVYFYSGAYDDGLEHRIAPFTKKMPEWLESRGYPGEKMMLDIDEAARHNESYWRLYFQPALAFGLGY